LHVKRHADSRSVLVLLLDIVSMSACGSSPAPPTFAFVKRVSTTFSGGYFAEVELLVGDNVARLADRICSKFVKWGVAADELALFPVTAEGDGDPSSEEMKAALARQPLQARWTLERAGVSAGAFLLALVSDAPAPADTTQVIASTVRDVMKSVHFLPEVTVRRWSRPGIYRAKLFMDVEEFRMSVAAAISVNADKFELYFFPGVVELRHRAPVSSLDALRIIKDGHTDVWVFE
jgi:hypothetical protein